MIEKKPYFSTEFERDDSIIYNPLLRNPRVKLEYNGLLSRIVSKTLRAQSTELTLIKKDGRSRR